MKIDQEGVEATFKLTFLTKNNSVDVSTFSVCGRNLGFGNYKYPFAVDFYSYLDLPSREALVPSQLVSRLRSAFFQFARPKNSRRGNWLHALNLLLLEAVDFILFS